MHVPPAPEASSRRLTIAPLIFVVCCLLSSGRIFWDARTPRHAMESSIDVEQRSDMRFAAIKKALPQRGVIGYIGKPGALTRGDYYLAEYALAPLVVDDSINHSVILGNFPDAPLSAPSTLQLVKDFGNGVALFTKKDAR